MLCGCLIFVSQVRDRTSCILVMICRNHNLILATELLMPKKKMCWRFIHTKATPR